MRRYLPYIWTLHLLLYLLVSKALSRGFAGVGGLFCV